MQTSDDLAAWCQARGHQVARVSVAELRASWDHVLAAQSETKQVADVLADMIDNDRFDLIGPMLETYFATPYHIVTNSAELRYYAPRFTRAASDTLTITFAEDFKASRMAFPQMRSLLWIMPLFDATMRDDVVVLGSAKLNQWDAGVEPGLSYCANKSEYALIPDPEFVRSRGYRDFRRELAARPVPWAERKPVALWRGATTDSFPKPPLTWRDMRRIRLSLISRDHPDVVDAGITDVHHWDKPELRSLIAAEQIEKPFLPRTEFTKFRYQIDIDGTTNAWAGLFTKLLTGSTVLKVDSDGHFRQWYYGRLVPWLHFVPVRADLADLIDKIAWLRRHDDEAQAIGRRGQALAHEMSFSAELPGVVDTIHRAFRAFG